MHRGIGGSLVKVPNAAIVLFSPLPKKSCVCHFPIFWAGTNDGKSLTSKVKAWEKYGSHMVQ